MRLLFLACILCLFSCKSHKDRPDVSDIQVNLKLERFEPAFFALDTNHLSEGLARLQQQFPRFLPFYMEVILSAPPARGGGYDTSALDIVRHVLRGYRPLYDTLQDKYGDMAGVKRDLTAAFRYVKYYYPNYRVPAIITYIASFDRYGTVLTPEYLGIGLHQFAGKNFSGYQDPDIQQIFPAYISRRFDQEYIVPSAMKVVVDDIYPDTSGSASLIDQMIEKGKQWWLLDHFLPDAPDSVKTGYTGKQLAFIERNEGNIWTAVQTNTPDLYTLDQESIQNYIGEAPFTQNLETSNSTPGNLGPWIGWRIINQFVQKNPRLTVQQVLATPSRTIFQEAKYRPK